MRKVLFILLLGVVISSCGPKAPTPKASLPALPAQYKALSFKEVKTVFGPWWESFKDPTLNHLVEKLLSQNYDLKEEAARVEELLALFRESRAAQFPRLDFSLQGQKNRTVVLAPYFRGGGFVTGRLTGALATSYEVDLWKKLSHATKAARLRLLAARENQLALAQSLIAQLVSAYLKRAFLACKLEVTREALEAEKTYVFFLERRYRLGLVDPTVLEEERRLLASLKAEVPRLEGELKTQAQEIRLLVGEYPSPEPSPSLCKFDLPLPPPGLPAELLLRRPDIRAARANLLAAAHEVSARRAARFPTLTLTAERGQLSNALNTLLHQRNRFWELAFSLTQPIFDAGRLKAEEKAAKARFKAQEAAYARTVLQAFFEVENALVQEKALREELSLAKAEEASACRAFEMKENRYRLGTASVLDYLKAKHFCLERRRHTLEIMLSLLLNRVSLYRALGGGWPKLKNS